MRSTLTALATTTFTASALSLLSTGVALVGDGIAANVVTFAGTGVFTNYGTMSVTTPSWVGTTPNYAGNIRQFNVTLVWTNAAHLRHARSLSTYVAQNGVQNYVY